MDSTSSRSRKCKTRLKRGSISTTRWLNDWRNIEARSSFYGSRTRLGETPPQQNRSMFSPVSCTVNCSPSVAIAEQGGRSEQPSRQLYPPVRARKHLEPGSQELRCPSLPETRRRANEVRKFNDRHASRLIRSTRMTAVYGNPSDASSNHGPNVVPSSWPVPDYPTHGSPLSTCHAVQSS